MKWIFSPLESEKIKEIQDNLDLPTQVVNILLQRKINKPRLIKDFLSLDLSMLHDPFLMKGMDIAVERIIKNIKNETPIFILGDYDVDGTSATSLLYLGIKELGGIAIPYIPNRGIDGHGISKRAIKKATGVGADLFITCDCGINESTIIEEGRNYGIDFIITDHHIPGENLPEAFTILNPKQEECKYPFKELSGSGVAFKLVSALDLKLKKSSSLLEKTIEIAALGTASDLVPLTGENRLIVHHGFKKMKSNSCVGIKTLIKATNIKNIAEIDVSNFNFKIAPLINAAGRVNDANIIVDLLTTEDDIQAAEIGNRLIRENKKRQFLQGIALKEALSRASLMNRETKLILLENDGWHPGVIGIIAAKIKNKFKRPAIIITFDQDGNGNGSARSLEGFNIYEILSHLKGYFDSFGGHPFAAGFTIQKNNLELFKKDLLGHVNKTKFKITEKNLILDGKLNLNDINHQFITTLNYLAPYGPGNLQPRFSLEKLSIIGNPKIIGSGSHLRFQVKQNQKVIDVVGFGLAESYKYLIAGKLIDIAGFPEVNIWKGKKRFQFNAKAIRLSI